MEDGYQWLKIKCSDNIDILRNLFFCKNVEFAVENILKDQIFQKQQTRFERNLS